MKGHTPGPLDLIDELWPHSRDILEAQYPAEARLIAAAPDLLEALKAAAGFVAQRSRPGKADPLAERTMETIQAALSKTEG